MKKLLLATTLILLAGTWCQAQTKSLWATATTGGALGQGTLLQSDSTGHNFTVVHSFDWVNGSYPIGKLAVADNGVVYCVTELGGYEGSCTVCKYNPQTATFSMIHQFFIDQYTGGEPVSGLVKLPNGLLVGTTVGGGSTCDTLTGVNGGGVIYTIDPATDAYTDVYNFADSLGYGPTMELLPTADGNLYGIVTSYTDSGGASLLFKFDPANSQYTTVYNFGATQAFASATPALVQGPDLKLYGVFNGQGNLGMEELLFSYDISTATFTILHNFSEADGIPQGGLLVANGNIYGETAGDTINNNGQIYRYTIAGGTFTTLAYFDSLHGIFPAGGLGMLGNNLLTGSAAYGGLYGYGTLFTFNLENNTFTTVLDFDSATTGDQPMCTILETGVIATGTTGIAPVMQAEFSVYPSPAAGELYIRNSQLNTPYTITNILGQVVDRGNLTSGNQVIDVSQLAGGVYLLNNVKFMKE